MEGSPSASLAILRIFSYPFFLTHSAGTRRLPVTATTVNFQTLDFQDGANSE
jgi:hypothetical protein